MKVSGQLHVYLLCRKEKKKNFGPLASELDLRLGPNALLQRKFSTFVENRKAILRSAVRSVVTELLK
jgi:hypothetical protein